MPIDLKKITKGKDKQAVKGGLYSPPGVGKTTFAASAPNVFLVDIDSGSHHLDVEQRVVPLSWDETREWVTAVETGQVRCETLVLDTLSMLEPMLHKKLFGEESINTWKGGFNKGAYHALASWRDLVAQLERVWRKGVNVLLTGHSIVRGFDDPVVAGSYDRFQFALNDLAAGFIFGWVDYMLFAREDVILQPIADGGSRATTTNTKRLYTRRTPAYDAKARGTAFPESLPLGWAEFARAIEEDDARSKKLPSEIEGLLAELGDAKVSADAHAWMKANPTKLVEARNTIQAKVEAKRRADAAGTQTATTAAA